MKAKRQTERWKGCVTWRWWCTNRNWCPFRLVRKNLEKVVSELEISGIIQFTELYSAANILRRVLETREDLLSLKLKKKKNMEHESDGYTNCNWRARYSHQTIGTRTGGLRKKRTSGDHLKLQHCWGRPRILRDMETRCHAGVKKTLP